MKKAYKKPELKEVELKRRASLLEASSPSVTGEVGYNRTFADQTAPKA